MGPARRYSRELLGVLGFHNTGYYTCLWYLVWYHEAEMVFASTRIKEGLSGSQSHGAMQLVYKMDGRDFLDEWHSYATLISNSSRDFTNPRRID
jgi:hypothetical protein